MTTDTHNRQLFHLLQENEILRLKGFSMAYTPADGIVIDRAGHVRGIWKYSSNAYTWISPGNSQPKFRTESEKSAVLYTVVVLAQE